MTTVLREIFDLIYVHMQDGDTVGLSGGEGLDKALQLKKKLLEFDQTRYTYIICINYPCVHVGMWYWNAEHVCTCASV